MDINDVKVIGNDLVLADQAEVDALQEQLWITFPDGYREYVTKLGEGILGGSFIRIYPPWRISNELADWRRRIAKYWFWDAGKELLPKERALECVIIGDTMNGDELIFHPLRLESLFVLPRDREQVYVTGDNLWTAIEWMCASGKLIRRFKKREFEPFDSRVATAETTARTTKVTDSEGETLDEIMELASHWGKRHSVQEMAKKELKRYAGKNKKTSLAFEGIMLKCDEMKTWPGYNVVYEVADKESGAELGVFYFSVSDDAQSSTFWPKDG